MMDVAADRGLEPVFVGAVRDRELPRRDSWDGFAVARVGVPLRLLNGKGLFRYVAGVSRFNAALLSELFRRRPGLVHASDMETAPASVVFHLATGTPLILNVHDNLADRYILPRGVRSFLRAIEGLAVRLSDVALVPEDFRRTALPGWCRNRVVVVRNSPKDGGASPPDLSPQRRVRVLYAGWLDWGRGLASLLQLADQHAWMDVQIAGEGDEGIVAAIKASRATYMGFLSHGEVMTATRRAHFIAAFYDPSRPINRAAAPNKLAEAFSAGRPVLINEEAMVAQGPALRRCTIRVKYHEIPTVADRIRALVGDGTGAYDAMCRAARQVYDSQYAWNGIRRQIDEVYGSLGL